MITLRHRLIGGSWFEVELGPLPVGRAVWDTLVRELVPSTYVPSPWRAGQHWKDGGDLYFVSDLHAMTTPYNPGKLRARTRELLAILVAAGIEPDTVFVQSDLLPQLGQLTWVLECACTQAAQWQRIIAGCAMLSGGIVPNYDIPHPPLMPVHEFGATYTSSNLSQFTKYSRMRRLLI